MSFRRHDDFDFDQAPGEPQPERRAGCLGRLIAYLILAAVAFVLFAEGLARTGLVPMNLLLLGVDRRPQETVSRSDTVVLLSFQPGGNRAVLLSIPRDLWLPIPLPDGRAMENRINVAYFHGEAERLPGGGPGLVMATVRASLGVPVSGYLSLDFDGFESVVDALGGVTVEIEREIYDPNYPTQDYGTTTVHFQPGVQHLDGKRALQYVRTRATPRADLDRLARQRQVLLAMRRQLASPVGLLRGPLVARAAWQAAETDLTPPELVYAAYLWLRLPPGGVVQAPVDQAVYTFVTAQGAQVLLPCRQVGGECRMTFEGLLEETLGR